MPVTIGRREVIAALGGGPVAAGEADDQEAPQLLPIQLRLAVVESFREGRTRNAELVILAEVSAMCIPECATFGVR